MISDQLMSGFLVITDADAIGSGSVQEDSCQIDISLAIGKSVALHCHPAHLARLAVLLDGVVESILLVPFDACEKLIKRIESAVVIDVVLVDDYVDHKLWSKNSLVINKVIDAFKGFKKPVRSFNTRWLLTTSGTTSTPKIVTHSSESLTRTVARKFINKELVWGMLYDPARFAGFQVVLQAATSGARLVIPTPNLSFEKKISFLVEKGCNALSATPTLWRKILMSNSSSKLMLKQITLGGELVDQSIINGLMAKYPNATITHIFASTEAGVGFSVKDCKAGFPIDWIHSGIRGVELKVSDYGTLCLRNTLRSQFYVDISQEIADEDGWIDTGDVVEMLNDRVFLEGA